MDERDAKQLFAMIGGFAELYDKPRVSPTALALWAKSLAAYPLAAIEKAFEQHAKGSKFMPRPADIIEILDAGGDGRPSPDEAWLMCPRDEAASVVWTEEMREAYAPLASARESDEIAARMAFRASYTRLVAIAKAEGRPPRWLFSPGRSVPDREPVIMAAIAKGRISRDYGVKQIPPPPVTAEKLMLAAPKSFIGDPAAIKAFIEANSKRASALSGGRS